MCGRTSLFVPPSVLRQRFDAEPPADFAPRYNVAPGDDLAVIRNDAPDVVDELTWRFVPHWADDPDDWDVINARAETVAEKPAFRDAYERRRCMVLADGFYEWQDRNGRSQPYRIEREDDRPFAMAGIWDRWEGADETVETVAILTTEPNDLLAPIHDRMPVLLPEDDERDWLEADDPGDLPGPYAGDDFEAYPVSTAVNDPANDSPDVVEPIDDLETDQQAGLDEFG